MHRSPPLLTTTLTIALAVIAASGVASDQTPEQSLGAAFDRDVRPLLDTYCASCHGKDKQKGDLSFAPYRSGRQALATRSLWHDALGRLTSRDMPPDTEPQPSDDERRTLIGWLKALRRLDPPDPGEAVIRRLSRIEYDHTVRDLFGVDLRAGANLPPDHPGEAFDNSTSPLLMEKYLLAADDVLDRLIMPERYQRKFSAGQLDAVIAGTPDAAKADGTERRFTEPAEVVTLLDLPVEGAYTLRIRAGAEQAGGEPVRLAVRFDNQVVSGVKITARTKSPGTYTCTVKAVPGRTRLSLVFMNPSTVESLTLTPAGNEPTGRAKPPTPPVAKKPEPPRDAKGTKDKAPVRALVIDSIEITGPPAKAPTETQRRLFTVTPGKDLEPAAAARAIIEPFAYRAFRRPLMTHELDALLKVFALADGQDLGFTDAVKLTMKAVLVSPQYLYRTPEHAPESTTTSGSTRAPAIVPLGDHDLATRLSYFLWATMPDEELLQLARDGRLRDPTVLEAQIRRLIADPRSRALAETFFAGWLGLGDFTAQVVDEKKFPLATPAARAAMYEEVMSFTDHLLRDGGSVLDLIDSDYTWLNDQGARLYGLDGIKGAIPQRVTLPDRQRGGLIGMPAILFITSRPERTSPVKRGKWLLETLYDAAPPPPPPNVDTLEKQDSADNATLTLRQKMERHRSDPNCATCHRLMDPLGFGLENFDPIGRWRDRDEHGSAIDAQGELPGKQRFSSPRDLKQILLARKDEFARTLVARLLAFALGRRLSGYDEVVVDDLAEGLAREQYRLDTLIVRIATSYPFLNRRALH